MPLYNDLMYCQLVSLLWLLLLRWVWCLFMACFVGGQARSLTSLNMPCWPSGAALSSIVSKRSMMCVCWHMTIGECLVNVIRRLSMLPTEAALTVVEGVVLTDMLLSRHVQLVPA